LVHNYCGVMASFRDLNNNISRRDLIIFSD
jgi:hypothetical protein